MRRWRLNASESCNSHQRSPSFDQALTLYAKLETEYSCEIHWCPFDVIIGTQRSNTSITPQRVRSSIRVGGNSVTEADGALRHIWCGVPLSMRSA